MTKPRIPRRRRPDQHPYWQETNYFPRTVLIICLVAIIAYIVFGV